MKQHEREFFIYTIRSGKVFLPKDIVIHPPTVDIIIQSLQKYNNAFNDASSDGIMKEDELSKWMKEQGLWTSYNENKIEELKKKIESLKIEIYESRFDKKLVSKTRESIRFQEKILTSELSQKNSYYINTCEGFATTEKTSYIIQNTTYQNNKLYDFTDLSLPEVVDLWYDSFLTEGQCRDLARNEPWKSLWIINKNAKFSLFSNCSNGDEPTYNQKNLIIWSQMYDNIHESIDCPTKEVIEDDDMLDGWFIIQNKKTEKEKINKEFEASTKNEKIKNSSEVFIVAKDKDKIKKIQELNSLESKKIIAGRHKMLEQKGTVNTGEFPDEKLNIHLQNMESLRNNAKKNKE
jgi:hypothetical protein